MCSVFSIEESKTFSKICHNEKLLILNISNPNKYISDFCKNVILLGKHILDEI